MWKWLLPLSCLLAVAPAGWALPGLSIRTTVYDLSTNFSASRNPSQGWSYGWMKAGSTEFQPCQRSFQWPVDGGQIERWDGSDAANLGVHIAHNSNGAQARLANVVWPAGMVSLHPGPNGERAVVRWTAPSAGACAIQVKFSALDKAGTTTDVHVLLNGNTLYDAAIAGAQDSKACSRTVSLKPGDTVDLAVGNGGNGNESDTTGVEAVLTVLGRPGVAASAPIATTPSRLNQTPTQSIPTPVGTGTLYDAATSFSDKANPVGPWSYGWENPGTTTFQRYGVCVRWAVTGGLNQLWQRGADTEAIPQITHNPNQQAMTMAGITWAPGALSLHPGPKGERSVLRWTAPVASRCSVQAKFTGLDKNGSTTDVHVLLNDQALFNGAISGGGDAKSFTQSFTVNAGDRVDFLVGDGGNGYENDSTGVEAKIVLLAPPAPAFDAAADFSTTANPGGPWSYGWTDAANPDFQRYGVCLRWSVTGGVNRLWQRGADTDPTPHIAFNPNADTMTMAGVTWASKTLSLHPGPNGGRSVLRWTAPAAGRYRIEARFTGIDQGGSTTDVHVVLRTRPVWASNITGPGDSKAYVEVVDVAPGDTLDFAVGDGGNGYLKDSTALTVKLTPQ